ncbi:ATP-grasp domain-containing protein [Onishia taeanensis]
MNILFTCAGRRNYLLADFKAAIDGGGMIMAADSSPHAPAMSEADKSFLLPRVDSADYLNQLISLCHREDVGLLFSLNDHELPLLSENRHHFQAIGTFVVVSPPEVVEMAFDKMATASFSESIGLSYTKTYEILDDVLTDLKRGEVQYPLLVKPRWGTASICIEEVIDERELILAWELGRHKVKRAGLRASTNSAEGLIIQEKAQGEEYGLDIVNDLHGKYQATFVKRKISMRAGETDKAITEHIPELMLLGKRVGEALQHIGNIDCDVFWTGKEASIIDINPRFGGGYPFSAAAGARVPEAILAWSQGKEPPVGWDNINYGVASSKCDKIVTCSSEMIQGRNVNFNFSVFSDL